MYINIRSNLSYQKGALELLHIYLQSEFQCLQYGGFEKVQRLESRIIRVVQEAFENHVELRRLLAGRSVREFADSLEDYLGRPLLALLEDIERFQESCREQAARNRALARVLDEEHKERIGAIYGIPLQDAGPEPVRYH